MTVQPIPRLTTPTKLVLRFLLAENRVLWTRQVSTGTDLSRYTTESVLNRLERAGWLTSEREDPATAYAEARGVRRFWQFTDEGRQLAKDVLEAGHAIQLPERGMSLD